MLELIHETTWTQEQLQALANSEPATPQGASQSSNKFTSQIDKSSSADVSTLQKSVHWSRRFRDPLGDALTRIQRSKTAKPDEVTLASVDVPCSAPPEASQSRATETLPFVPARPQYTLSSGRPGATGNRRKFPRRHSECQVFILPRAETHDLTPREIDWLLLSGTANGRLQNLSQLGICVLIQKEVPEGTEVLLRITNCQIQRNVDMSARVVRCQSTRPGLYSIHCQTLRSFTLDELQDLGQPLFT